jgi:hypothetical protein
MIRDDFIPDLVSRRQAAEILDVVPQAVTQMTADGRLRGAKVDSAWVYRREAVEALKAKREHQP